MKNSFSMFLSFLILICSCTSQTDKNSKKFTLQGEIKDQDTGIIVLEYFSDPTLFNDTAEIENGKFIFTGRISEPTSAALWGRNYLELARIYLEPQMMDISIYKDKPFGSKITGSKTQSEFDLLNKMEEPFYERLSMLRAQVFNIDDSIKNSIDGPAKLLMEKKSEEIYSLLSQIQKKIDSIEIKFVLENPKSFVSVEYLNMLGGNEVISLDSTKSIFNGLDNSIKKGRYGKKIIEDIRNKESIRIGAQAADFKATDLNQLTITLSQFKGKNVVLLDFWASWCVPCRQSIPHLKNIYKKYHSKGLEVIAISKDADRKAWIEAVNQDSTEMWYHILVAEKYEADLSQITNDYIEQKYLVTSIPVQVLIDKNGQIIGRFRGASEEKEDSLDRLLSQIFDN